MFRHGYSNTFPKTNPVTDEQVQEAFDRDQQKREDRDAEMNLTRRRDSFEVGDQVILKNSGHTKFQPVYGPDPKTVIAVEERGVTCKDAKGAMQRRHQDDIKLAPTQATSSMQRPSCVQTNTTSIEDSALEGNNRPVRARKPNPRYNENEYILD